MGEKLLESDVGITEYMNSDIPGFTGILKARFSDFHVNEIDLDGNIAKLTNTQIPKEFLLPKHEHKAPPTESPIDQISQDVWASIVKLVQGESTNNSPEIELDVTQLSKDDRTSIHDTIKKIFEEKIVSNTVAKDDLKFISFRKHDKDNKGDQRSRWPVEGEYVYFLLYKEAADTLQATYKLCSSLRMKASCFNYAGVKDKRAKTTQWFSAKKLHPVKLIQRMRKIRNIKVGNFKFEDKPLRLGDLKGNQFRVALRNVTSSEEDVNKCLESVKKTGFVNYYGLQRFGSEKEVPTYCIGIKLLQGKFKEACELILQVKTTDDRRSDITRAKKVYADSKDAKAAHRVIRDSEEHSVESKLLGGLAQCGENDYVTALECVARNMRLLYIHSFQSYVWNRVVSRRVKEFGAQVVLGDLVNVKDEDKEKEKERSNGNGSSIADTKEDTEKIDKRQQVVVITAENIANYTIFDVVLPLPGYDISYPENLKDYYSELLAEHELTLDMPKQRVATYTLSGTYRKIIQSASNVSWYTMKYNDPTDTLIRSDFEEILKHTEPVSDPNGKYNAVIISFELPSSAYATMCLREAMKMDTSSTTHSKLNDYNTTMGGGEKGEPLKPVDIDAPQSTSLLADKDRFESFKKSIFGTDEDESSLGGEKRKLTKEEVEDEVDAKKSKLAEEKE